MSGEIQAKIFFLSSVMTNLQFVQSVEFKLDFRQETSSDKTTRYPWKVIKMSKFVLKIGHPLK